MQTKRKDDNIMFFIKSTKKYLSRSVGGLMDDVKEISGKASKKKKIAKSNPKKTYQNCIVLSAVMFALMILNIIQKEKNGIILFAVLFIVSVAMAVAMLFSMVKNGDVSIDQDDPDIKAEVADMERRYEERRKKRKARKEKSKGSEEEEGELEDDFDDTDSWKE